MKIELDLSKSYNHYHWQDKKELSNYINNMVKELWELYNEIGENISDEKYISLYDILDMFNKFEIKESEE